MSKPPAHVDALVEDTTRGCEALLSPAALKQVRSLLRDTFEAHPVMKALIAEGAIREEADASGDRPVTDADKARIARKKTGG
jgi:hypothetical protein